MTTTETLRQDNVLGKCEYCGKKMREWKGENRKHKDFKGRKNHLTCWVKKQDELKIQMLCDNICKI